MNTWNQKPMGVLAMAAFAWSMTACGAAEPMESVDDSQSSADTGGTVLADLKIGESTVRLEQLDDGSIVVIEGAPPGAERAVSGARLDMSPPELFRALAPDAEVPAALIDFELAEQAAAATESASFEPADITETPSSDLAGKDAQFIADWCGFCGADLTGCVSPVGSTTARWGVTAHKFGTYWWEQSGDGFTLSYTLDGTHQGSWTQATGIMWYFARHHGHFIGIPNQKTSRVTALNYGTMHTSMWADGGDAFISGPGCH
jgi:hypothetical protein